MMDIRKNLEAEHSRAMTTRIIRYVGEDQKRFDELLKLVLEGDFTMAQRASWPVSDLVEADPALVKKHIPKIIKKLNEDGVHDAVRRNLVKALQFVEIPEKYCGEMLDICYSFIRSELVAIAIRAYAIKVVTNICLRFPELKGEFRIILKELNELSQSPGMKVRVRDALRDSL